jgi:hypothetical protein
MTSIMMPDFQAVFVNTDQSPIKTEHVCYYVHEIIGTSDSPKKLRLNEVVYETYPHPDAPKNAVIKLLTTRTVCLFPETSPRAALLVLMNANQQAMQAYVSTIKS